VVREVGPTWWNYTTDWDETDARAVAEVMKPRGAGGKAPSRTDPPAVQLTLHPAVFSHDERSVSTLITCASDFNGPQQATDHHSADPPSWLPRPPVAAPLCSVPPFRFGRTCARRTSHGRSSRHNKRWKVACLSALARWRSQPSHVLLPGYGTSPSYSDLW